MKTWMLFVLLTVLTWGAYVPTIHQGQITIGKDAADKGPLRAFLFVGIAYFVVACAVLVGMLAAKLEPWSFRAEGVKFSFIAGILGAVGALGIVFAFKYGGKPAVVPPMVFAGAPIMSTFVAMLWHKPTKPVSPMFFVGIVVAAIGTAMVLRFKPS